MPLVLFVLDSGWSGISERNVKENSGSEDGQEMLASLAEIPIETRNLKREDPSVRRIGPMAQDF